MSAALVIMACSSGDAAPTPTPVPPPSAGAALENARQAMLAVDSFRFELTHPAGATSLAGGLSLQRAEGAVSGPERLQIKAEAELGRLFVRVEAIVIGDHTWMTNPLTGNWAEIDPADSPFSFLDPAKLVADVLRQISAPAYKTPPAATGDLLITGSVPAEVLASLVGTVQGGSVLTVDLTLDRAAFTLKEARITGRLQPDDGPETVRVITFFGFGEQISIEPPI